MVSVVRPVKRGTMLTLSLIIVSLRARFADREWNMVFRFVLIAVFLGLGQMAWAQPPKSFQATIDQSFAVTPTGEPYVIAGKPYYLSVGVHKVMAHEGRVYACVSYLMGAGQKRDEFMRKSSLLDATGKVVKRGFLKVSNPVNSSKVTACRKSAQHSAICSQVFPADLSLVLGEKVTCHRTNKKADQGYVAAPGEVRVPTRFGFRSNCGVGRPCLVDAPTRPPRVVEAWPGTC